MKFSHHLSLSAATILPLLGPSAHAQAVDPAPAQAATADAQGGGLTDIVVTAQKRSENLQKVPISVIAESGKALETLGIRTTSDLGAIAPGLNVRTTAGSFMPSIRGIGTSSNVVENPVALYVDGIYIPQQRDGLRDLNDIEQVAVLKGPQGTLFGRNATGGVIQVTTLAPSQDFKGHAGFEIDNYALAKGDLYLTGGLTDSVAASLSVQSATQGRGWGKDLATGNDTFRLLHSFSVRSKVLFKPSPDTSITLIGDYIDRRALANSFQPYPGTLYSFPMPTPLNNRHDSYGGVDSVVAYKGGGLSLTVEQRLAFGKVVAISSWRNGNGEQIWDNGGNPASFFIIRIPKSPNEDYTEEVQLISNPGRLSWAVGAFYFHNLNAVEPISRTITGPLAPAPTSVTLNTTFGREVAESIAPFAQADFAISPDTKITAGVRYTYEKRRAKVTNTLLRVNGTTIVQPLDSSATIKEPTFRIALSQQLSSDTMAYASFNTGVKSGGFNIVNAANPAYLPEKLKAYEVGLKTQFADRRVRLNLSGFYYNYTNVQVIQFVSGTQSIVNGASAKLYGLDADFAAEVVPGLRLSGGLELLHSEFTNYPNAVLSQPAAGGGVKLTSGNANGNRLPLAQNLTSRLSLDYHTDAGKGSIDYNLSGNYNGNYFFDPDNVTRQGAYTLLNTSLTYNFPGDRLSVGIWGKNLFDAQVILQATAQSFGYTATYGRAPRTFGFTAKLHFQ